MTSTSSPDGMLRHNSHSPHGVGVGRIEMRQDAARIGSRQIEIGKELLPDLFGLVLARFDRGQGVIGSLHCGRQLGSGHELSQADGRPSRRHAGSGLARAVEVFA